jgi:hypothetical protein
MPGSHRPRSESPQAPGRAPRGESESGKRPATPPPLEERTRLELFELATELGIAGRGDMSKSELIEAIRRR